MFFLTLLVRIAARLMSAGMPTGETICSSCLSRTRITEKGVVAAHFPRNRRPPEWAEVHAEVERVGRELALSGDRPYVGVNEPMVMSRLRKHWCAGAGRAP